MRNDSSKNQNNINNVYKKSRKERKCDDDDVNVVWYINTITMQAIERNERRKKNLIVVDSCECATWDLGDFGTER